MKIDPLQLLVHLRRDWNYCAKYSVVFYYRRILQQVRCARKKNDSLPGFLREQCPKMISMIVGH